MSMKIKTVLTLGVGAAFSLALVACGGSGDRADRVVLQNKGSDTLVNVAQAWAEAYKDVNANVAIAVTACSTLCAAAVSAPPATEIVNSTWVPAASRRLLRHF